MTSFEENQLEFGEETSELLREMEAHRAVAEAARAKSLIEGKKQSAAANVNSIKKGANPQYLRRALDDVANGFSEVGEVRAAISVALRREGERLLFKASQVPTGRSRSAEIGTDMAKSSTFADNYFAEWGSKYVGFADRLDKGDDVTIHFLNLSDTVYLPPCKF